MLRDPPLLMLHEQFVGVDVDVDDEDRVDGYVCDYLRRLVNLNRRCHQKP